MKIKNKLMGLLLPLYLAFYQPSLKAETRAYNVNNKTVDVEVNNSINSIKLEVSYETVSNLEKIKGPLDTALGNVESLSLSANSNIYAIIPKGIKVNRIDQEVELYNIIQKRKFSKTVQPPTKFEKSLEEIATKIFLGSLGIPSIASQIGQYLKQKSDQMEEDFINRLAKEEKGYAVGINLNYYFKDSNEFETSTRINIELAFSNSIMQMLDKANIRNLEGEGVIYFKLLFDKNETPILDNLEVEDQIPFTFHVTK